MRQVASTSIQAFQEVKPHRGRRHELIMALFFEVPGKPDWSNRELARELGVLPCLVSPRVYELREMGLLAFSRVRRCLVTGRRVNAWKLNEVRIR